MRNFLKLIAVLGIAAVVAGGVVGGWKELTTDSPVVQQGGEGGGDVAGATVVFVGQGGTGLSTVKKGDMLYSSALNTLARLASSSPGTVLTMSGSRLPSWAAPAAPTGVADSDVPFVTIGNTSSLSFERALTGTSNQITVTDGGANGAVTLSVPSLLSLTNASVSATLESSTIKVDTITNSTGTLSIGAFTLTGTLTGSSTPTITGIGAISATSMALTTASVSSTLESSVLKTDTLANSTGTLSIGAYTLTGTITGSGTPALTGIGAITATGIIDFGGATSLKVPNGTGGTTVDANGKVTVDTSSKSFNFYAGEEIVIGPWDKCVAQSLAGTDLTSKNQWTIFTADEPYTIGSIQYTSSGSNSLTWQLLTGSATVPTTTVFSASPQASGSAIVKRTSFNTSAISDGQKLDIVVSSTSATLDSVFVRVCMKKTP